MFFSLLSLTLSLFSLLREELWPDEGETSTSRLGSERSIPFSIISRACLSLSAANVIASPSFPARPVRPIR
jgi:hypothetical protein